jgi:hypothetical protein
MLESKGSGVAKPSTADNARTRAVTAQPHAALAMLKFVLIEADFDS